GAGGRHQRRGRPRDGGGGRLPGGGRRRDRRRAGGGGHDLLECDDEGREAAHLAAHAILVGIDPGGDVHEAAVGRAVEQNEVVFVGATQIGRIVVHAYGDAREVAVAGHVDEGADHLEGGREARGVREARRVGRARDRYVVKREVDRELVEGAADAVVEAVTHRRDARPGGYGDPGETVQTEGTRPAERAARQREGGAGVERVLAVPRQNAAHDVR